jgi:hypothetical protein
VFAELQGAAVIPVPGYTFVFRNPDTEIFQTPAVGPAGQIGVGAHF